MQQDRESMLDILNDRVVRPGPHNLDASPRCESADRELLETLSDHVLSYLVEDVEQLSPEDEFELPSQTHWPMTLNRWHCWRPMRASPYREAICPRCGGRFFTAEQILDRKRLAPEVESLIDEILGMRGNEGNEYEREKYRPIYRRRFHEKGIDKLHEILAWHIKNREDIRHFLDRFDAVTREIEATTQSTAAT